MQHFHYLQINSFGSVKTKDKFTVLSHRYHPRRTIRRHYCIWQPVAKFIIIRDAGDEFEEFEIADIQH